MRNALPAGPSRSSRCVVRPRGLRLLLRDIPLVLACRVSANCRPPLMSLGFPPLHRCSKSLAAPGTVQTVPQPPAFGFSPLDWLPPSRSAFWPSGLLHPVTGRGVRRVSGLRSPTASRFSRSAWPAGFPVTVLATRNPLEFFPHPQPRSRHHALSALLPLPRIPVHRAPPTLPSAFRSTPSWASCTLPEGFALPFSDSAEHPTGLPVLCFASSSAISCG